MYKLFFCVGAMCCLVSLVHGAVPSVPAEPPVPERGFISAEPATTWERGLICGNGTIGANALSRPLDETVVFTHERLFLPARDPIMPPSATAARLFEIRRLIERGLYSQATQLAFDLSGQESFLYPDPFVPAFDLRIEMQADGEVAAYRRSVDFQKGEAVVHWSFGGEDRFQRRLFVSRADGVAVLLINGATKGSVNCRFHIEPRTPSKDLDARQVERSNGRFEETVSGIVTKAENNFLTWHNDFTKAYPGSIQSLDAAVRVVAPGGTLEADTAGIVVQGADHVLLFVGIECVYDPHTPRMDAVKEKLAALPADYSGLLARHARLHGALFNRMRLDIGGAGEDHTATTEELLAQADAGTIKRALIEKEFDAGRYNIISCIGELPPTLQGVWGGTYVPGWASDFTHNGNVPSAIASLLNGNMPELMLAYTSYIESIVPYLEINAKHMFGCRGVVLPSRSTTNGFNNALAPRFAGGFWVAGAAWAAHFFYDYYLFTGDRTFLAEHALPFMEKVALFFEDYLYEGPDGTYIFSPTQSPENTPGNTHSQGSFNSTMAVAAAKELLRNITAASKELGVHHDKIPVWQGMLAKMPPYMINEEGVIKEWLTPKLTNRDSHRHSSQLYPLFDGMADEIAGDEKLQAAFKKVIELKLERHWKHKRSGFMSFGLVQLGQAAASLGEGDLAFRCLEQLAVRYWLHNLASMHNHKSLFNMDISGGMPAVVIGMLAGSAPGTIKLLPALPRAWPSGTVEGILCRGEIEIKKLAWTDDAILATLASGKKQYVTVEVPFEVNEVSVEKGNAGVRRTGSRKSFTVTLPEGDAVTLKITR